MRNYVHEEETGEYLYLPISFFYINFHNRRVHSAGKAPGGVLYHRSVCDLTAVNIVAFHCHPVCVYCSISLPSFSFSTCKY